MLLLPICAILFGLVAIVFSADRFTASAVDIADNFGVSQMMIGLTIVAFGTSAPEVIVSINAAFADAGSIALGNAIGSNLANTGMVLGITALVLPVACNWMNVRVELAVFITLSIVGAVCIADGYLSRLDGFVLVGLLAFFCYLIVSIKIKEARAQNLIDADNKLSKAQKKPFEVRPVVLFLIYLALLIVSSSMLIWGAKAVAVHFGISQLVIGLTIVAIGTSLPELAASLASALKGHHDIALGAIVGSNIFNIGAVLGLAGIIAPFNVERIALTRDYVAMLAFTFLLLLILIVPRMIKKTDSLTIGRFAGFALLGSYIIYGLLLIQTSA